MAGHSAAVRSRRPATRRDRSYTWLQGLVSGLAAALFPGPALLAALLLAPGLVALALDRAPSKPAARAILLFGAAATIPPLVRLWHLGATVDSALTLLGDPALVATAWLLGAIGWLLDQFAPLLVRYALDAAVTARVARLNGERARLAEAWGLGSEPESPAER